MATKNTTTRRKTAPKKPTTAVVRCGAVVTGNGKVMVSGYLGDRTPLWKEVKEQLLNECRECDFTYPNEHVSDVVLFEVELPLPKVQEMKPRFKVTVEENDS